MNNITVSIQNDNQNILNYLKENSPKFVFEIENDEKNIDIKFVLDKEEAENLMRKIISASALLSSYNNFLDIYG